VARRLHEANEEIRILALLTLGRIGAAAAPHIELIAKLLREDDSVYVRRNAAQTIGLLGTAAAPHISLLSKGLDDADKIVRRTVAHIISLVSEASATHMAHRLNDEDTEVRRSCARGLARMGAAAAPQSEAVVEGLTDKDARVRSKSAYAIATMGPSAGVSVPQLAKGLLDSDHDVRTCTAVALSSVQPRRRSSWRMGAEERIGHDETLDGLHSSIVASNRLMPVRS